jgi:hypothetical protein
MVATTIVALTASLLGQAVKSDPNLDFMKTTAASYRFVRDGDPAEPLQLQAEPAFRMGKQSADAGVEEGAIFFWTNDAGRPEAAAQVFLVRNAGAPNGLWIHEFISLSPGAFRGDRGGSPSWSPREPGVEFRPVPSAPKPGVNAVQRSAQMRALAREFHASDYFHDKQWLELRLLPTPVARFGKADAGSAVEDGGLFAFVTGTDPEAFLFLEVRKGKDGPEWQYAFAPMTRYELKGTHAGKAVWSIPSRKVAKDPSKPYFVRTD